MMPAVSCPPYSQDFRMLRPNTLPTLDEISSTSVLPDALCLASAQFVLETVDLHRAHLSELVGTARRALPTLSDVDLAAVAVRVCALDRLLSSSGSMRAWVLFDNEIRVANVPVFILEWAAAAPLLMREEGGKDVRIFAGFDADAIAQILSQSPTTPCLAN